MRRSSQSSPSRGGFTLVELLVVITIIAIMFALISAAAVKIMGKGDEVKLRSEVSQLALGVTAFKQQYAVGYVPDRIVLPPGYDSASAQYLKSIWPRLTPATLGTGTGAITVNNTPYASVFQYWGVQGTQPVVLHGDQCLVFFLGGAADASGNRISFCSDPTDPMNRTSANRVTRFYEFPTDRLKLFNGPNPEVSGLPQRAVGFPSFVDVYGAMPYLYFSTNKADNAYQNQIAVPNPAPNAANPSPYNLSWFPVNPYARSNPATGPQYANPSSFQIISAGKDGIFGTGGLAWAGATGGSATTQSADDVANFHPTFLGVPAQ